MTGFGTTADGRLVVFSKARRQQFIRIYAKAARVAENLANQKIFKRTGGSAHEALETNPKENHMLWTIFVVLLILWLLGFTVGHIVSPLLHLLLVVAVVVLIINLISGRRV